MRELILDTYGVTVLGSGIFGTGAYGVGIYGAGPYDGGPPAFPMGQLNIVPLGPRAQTKWKVDSVICSCDSSSATRFIAYRNAISTANEILSTNNGNQDNLWLRTSVLSHGESIIGVWFNGDVGANAVMRLSGLRFVPEY